MNVFISYASQDVEWARELTKALKRSGFRAWDPSEIGPGENWSLEIGKALEKSDAMVVLLSPASARSESVKREIDYALTSKRFHERLIPVMVKQTTKYPWVLADLVIEKGEPNEVVKRIAKRLRATSSMN